MNLLLLLVSSALGTGEGSEPTAAEALPEEDSQVLAALPFPHLRQETSTIRVGARYIWPGRELDCDRELYELFVHGLVPALREAANALPASATNPSAPPYDFTRTSRYDLGADSYLYSTPLIGTTADVDTDYLRSIRDSCWVNKANDVRFVYAGWHYHLTLSCRRLTAAKTLDLVRKLDQELHPHWLVVSPCGGVAQVDEGAKRTGIVTFMGIEVWPRLQPQPTTSR